MHKLIINTDGASRGNPGLAAVGIVISDGSEVLEKTGKTLGVATNNEAEYLAVKNALEIIKEKYSSLLPVEIEIRADSQLVVQQLCGNYKIKNERLRVFFDQIKCLELEVGRVYYHYIPRSQNALADEQANIALDAA